MKTLLDHIIEVSCGSFSSKTFLLVGNEKTALIDCGMAYCAPDLISNIRQALPDGRILDYVFLSHSHYDHIGALPYLREAWPQVDILAAKYAQNVLTKKGALAKIKELGNEAADRLGASSVDYDDDLMKVDRVISDGESVDLGSMRITVLETPGHTQCSLTFVVNDEAIFASETTGVLLNSGKIHANMINSYKETIKSIKKCQNYPARYIFSPHVGLVRAEETATYWQRGLDSASLYRDFF